MLVEVDVDFDLDTIIEELQDGETLGEFLASFIGDLGLNGSKQWEENLKRGVREYGAETSEFPRHTMHGLAYLVSVLADATEDEKLIKLSQEFIDKVDKRMEEMDMEGMPCQ